MSDEPEKKLILDEGSLQLQTESTREWVEQLTLLTNRHLIDIDENGKLKSTGTQSQSNKDFRGMDELEI